MPEQEWTSRIRDLIQPDVRITRDLREAVQPVEPVGNGTPADPGPAAVWYPLDGIRDKLAVARVALRRVVNRCRNGVGGVAAELDLVAGLKERLRTLLPELSRLESALEGFPRNGNMVTPDDRFNADLTALVGAAREVHARATMIGGLVRRPLPWLPLVAFLLSIVGVYALMTRHPDRPDRASATESSRLSIARAALARARSLAARPAEAETEAVTVASAQEALRTATRMLVPVLGQLERGATAAGGLAYGEASVLIGGVAQIDSAIAKHATPLPGLRRMQVALLDSLDTAAFDPAGLRVSTTAPHQHLTWHLLVGFFILAFLLSSAALLAGFLTGQDASLSTMMKDVFDKALAKSSFGAATLAALVVGGPAIATVAAAVVDHRLENSSPSDLPVPPPPAPPAPPPPVATGGLADSLARAIDASVRSERPLGQILSTVSERTRADSVRLSDLQRRVGALDQGVREVRDIAQNLRGRLGPADRAAVPGARPPER